MYIANSQPYSECGDGVSISPLRMWKSFSETRQSNLRIEVLKEEINYEATFLQGE